MSSVNPLDQMTKAHWRTLLSLMVAAGDSANEESHLERVQGAANVAGIFSDKAQCMLVAQSVSLIRQHMQTLP